MGKLFFQNSFIILITKPHNIIRPHRKLPLTKSSTENVHCSRNEYFVYSVQCTSMVFIWLQIIFQMFITRREPQIYTKYKYIMHQSTLHKINTYLLPHFMTRVSFFLKKKKLFCKKWSTISLETYTHIFLYTIWCIHFVWCTTGSS